jgi:two-component system, cell cycle response regulator
MSNCLSATIDIPPESRQLLEARSETPASAGLQQRSKIGSSRRILVVENGEAKQPLLKQMLQEWRFEVVSVCSGSQALEILEKPFAPGLVILNSSLGDTSGVELCRQICASSNDYLPYILMLWESGGKTEVVQSLAAGASDCLVAPFEIGETKARLTAADRILQRQESLMRSRDTFRTQAMIDSLTGVWNRRAILEIVDKELKRAQRGERSTGFLLLDLDHFKNVNDTQGHLVGDLVLLETCKRLKQVLRTSDFIGRYGGEEFLIIAPGADEKGLCDLAERLRATIESHSTCTGRNEIRITASIGAAIAPAAEASTADVIAVVDAALYTAKMMGRNRTVFSANKPSKTFNPKSAASLLAASLAAS